MWAILEGTSDKWAEGLVWELCLDSQAQEQRWESSTEHEWGGWDAVAALRKVETIWNSCQGLGSRG